MTDPHHPMTYSSDAQPVRPGTSAALTARTIDATVHPPLVRAQESAAALVPRVAEAAAPFASPVILSLVALTLTFVLIARRMRYRPSAWVLGALLVVTLSSFHPMPPPVATVAKVRTPRTLSQDATARAGRQLYPTPGAYGYSAPQPPDVPVTPDPPEVVEFNPRQWIPPELIERVPEMSRDLARSAERMMRENEQMRALMERLQYKLRAEARHRRARQSARRYRVRSGESESVGYDYP